MFTKISFLIYTELFTCSCYIKKFLRPLLPLKKGGGVLECIFANLYLHILTLSPPFFFARLLLGLSFPFPPRFPPSMTGALRLDH